MRVAAHFSISFQSSAVCEELLELLNCACYWSTVFVSHTSPVAAPASTLGSPAVLSRSAGFLRYSSLVHVAATLLNFCIYPGYGIMEHKHETSEEKLIAQFRESLFEHFLTNADLIRPEACSRSNGRVASAGGTMTFITLPQSGSIIDLDNISFVIRIQSKTGGRGLRVGLGHSELQIITPEDARRFLEELRDSKQVNVDNLLQWIRSMPTSLRAQAEPRQTAKAPQPEPVGT